jgi:hypothetical protein
MLLEAEGSIEVAVETLADQRIKGSSSICQRYLASDPPEKGSSWGAAGPHSNCRGSHITSPQPRNARFTFTEQTGVRAGSSS